ncbi:16S rRNA (guanine(527)-N(7))-methyltransferase RsmG [Acidobacteria bacterium AH-259-O06]|nr:16S rRNA (guanine(527)-N(7))-methyltransferase RsmG [Acidobacteria bacterium AH-259-O06]
MSLGLTPVAQLEKAYDIKLTADQKHRIRLYLDLLKRWNRRINLTSVDRTEELLRFHFFESFWAAQLFLDEGAAVADVGSGAGFPGLAMKLYRPSLHLSLLEKNHKKVVFLQEVSRLLDLDVEIFHGRAESFANWNAIEVATFRALKPSQELLQIFSSRGVRLLYFHGKDLEESVRGLPVMTQAKVPQSRNRYVALLQC